MTRAQMERTVFAVAALGLGVAVADASRRAPLISLAGDSRARLALGLAAGWAVVAAGIVLHRSGWRALGRLLAAGGCAWLAAGLAPGARSALLYTLGLTVTALAAAPIGWALLVAAAGRLRRADRVVVAALCVTLGALVGLLPAIVPDPGVTDCAGACPANLLGLFEASGTGAALSRAGVRAGLVAIGACVVLAIWRLARAPVARRQRAWLLVLPGCVYLVLVAAQLGHDWHRGYFVASDHVEQGLWASQAVALLALAAGVGLLQVAVQRRRSRLAQLVVELADASHAGGLREALADLLGDPTLELLHASEDGWLDPSGHVGKLPAEPTTTPLLRDGAPVALLHHRPELLEDPRAVAEIERTVRLGLDHERLQAELRHQLAHLRRSRADVAAASESERRLLERDLHDGAQQRLAAFTFAAGLACQRVSPELEARLRLAQREVQGALEELREIAHGLYPVALAEAGLGAAIESLADRRPGLQPGEVTGERFPPTVEETAYFVIATLADHWSPRPVTVTIKRAGERLLVELRASASPPDDLVALEDRLGALDGALTAHVTEPDQAHITVELPCA